ncbi:hypothetical protein [Bifidobacterium aerophilum]|uniref:DUF2142 domain-containing protein n=1 Tax=Bifidobacterium aerophilum TaxID=1798155 RepID=A0A6N9Z713_9BIFI|nr:hypothetical protein [Bifidobacterium aerophilum]NEG90190.1 hypothetical protein [Bifidobacterium aerophilum]
MTIASIRRAKPYIIAVAVIVFLELFLFNLPHWQTIHAHPEQTDEVEVGSGLTIQDDGMMKVTDPDEAWRVISSDSKIRYLYVNPSDAEHLYSYDDSVPQDQRQSISLVWRYSTMKPTDGGWYDGDAIQGYSPDSLWSRYSLVNDGATKVKIRYITSEGALIPHSDITANPRIPFRFSFLRLTIELLLASLALLFRPGSALYRKTFRLRSIKCAIPVTVLVAVECFVAVGLVMLTSAPERASAQFQYWSYFHSLWATDQYQMLADSIIHGRVNLDYPVNDALAAMSNPYDVPSRIQVASDNPNTPVYFDVAFKDGKYYSYFGVLPVLLFYVPKLLLTGYPLATSSALMICDVLATVAGAILVLQIARFLSRRGKKLSLGAVMLGCVAMFLGTGIAMVLPYGLFYPIPQVCAVAFAMMGVACWLEAKMRDLNIIWLAAGSLCLALTVACRPQVILASVLALPLFWEDIKRLWQEGLHDIGILRREITVWASSVIPYLIVIAAQFLYNKARFGKITDFGANYNLTSYDMTHNPVTINRYISFIFYYFFQPPNLSGRFPFVNEVLWPQVTFRSCHYDVGGYFLAMAPFALIVFAVALWRENLRKDRTLVLFRWLIALVVVIYMFGAHANGVDFRYSIDFSWLIIIAMMLLIFTIDDQVNIGSGLAHNETVKYHSIIRGLVFGFIVVGLLLSGLMTFLKQFMVNASNLYPSMNIDVDTWWNVSSWFLFLR